MGKTKERSSVKKPKKQKGEYSFPSDDISGATSLEFAVINRYK